MIALETDGRDRPAVHNGLDRLSFLNRLQLLVIPNDDQAGKRWKGPQEIVKQSISEHEGFLDDHHINRQRVAGMVGVRVVRVPEDRVDGVRLDAGFGSDGSCDAGGQ
nr:hypothetical protein [Microvirga tunisiensis]